MPAPEITLPRAAGLYLHNRAEFYQTLLSRLPEEILRARLADELEPFAADALLLRAVEQLPATPDGTLLSALMLRDLLKKSGCGAALARTSISVDDALNNAQRVEEAGVLLFSLLARRENSPANVFGQELAVREKALASLIRLDDELRYHRLRLTPTK